MHHCLVLCSTCCNVAYCLKAEANAVIWQGLVAMSTDVEAVHAALLSNRVPQQWVKVGYPSLLPLGKWLKDLQARVAFFQAWLRRGQPTTFWLAAFFFPQVLPEQPPASAPLLPPPLSPSLKLADAWKLSLACTMCEHHALFCKCVRPSATGL